MNPDVIYSVGLFVYAYIGLWFVAYHARGSIARALVLLAGWPVFMVASLVIGSIRKERK